MLSRTLNNVELKYLGRFHRVTVCKMRRRTKKLIIYEDRKTGSLFIRATKIDKHGDFRLKDDSYGKALSGTVSDAELGKAVRNILQNCD